MKFNYIDIENWKRKAHYRHYLEVFCKNYRDDIEKYGKNLEMEKNI